MCRQHILSSTVEFMLRYVPEEVELTTEELIKASQSDLLYYCLCALNLSKLKLQMD